MRRLSSVPIQPSAYRARSPPDRGGLFLAAAGAFSGPVGRKNTVRVSTLDRVRCHASTSSEWKQSVLLMSGVVARYLVYRGLAETGWPRGSEPARPDSRFTEWRRNLLLPEAPVPAPPGYRLTELGWQILERGQYARRQ
jgi:hypothetical protein